MTGSPGAVDFFALEASDYLDQLDALLADGGAPAAEPFARAARALRGSAVMARRAHLADLAGAIENAGAAVREGRLSWSRSVGDALVGAIDTFKALLRAGKDLPTADEARAAARTAELRGLAAGEAEAPTARPAPVVPIATLFYEDEGPHVVHRNPRPPITADLRFRQAAVPLASTLRRLIGDARHATDDASRRTAGDDLRAALRDLGELAASYDIRPVVNFARAREDSLAALDDRALEIVDGAAQSLVESAGTVWARPTPPMATGVIEPPAPTPASTPPTPAPAPARPAGEAPAAESAPRRSPPSGQALVALLETSITGLHELRTDTPLATDAPVPSVPVRADGMVSIDTLLYRGRAALDRAREVRDELRRADPPDPVLLAELYDLLDLAAMDEPARA